MKIKNNILKAFTLIELLVVIALISIIWIWVSSIDFNAISDKEKNTWFSDKIRTSIETIKNNAIIWKWFWTDLIVPDFWKISLENTWATSTWSINIYYWTWTKIENTTWHKYNWFNFKNDKHQKITSTKCNTTAWNNSEEISPIDILITWKLLTLSWCTDDNTQKVIEITTSYKRFSKTIKLNTVSWVISY